MERNEVNELFYISHIENVPSIIKHGILSHNESKKINSFSIAMPEIQQKRKDKIIPGAGKLHDYANLYFDAHNPMLSKCREHNDKICILCINSGILDQPGIIISDQNAASDYAGFYDVYYGLKKLDKHMVYAESWKHPDDEIMEWRHKSVKCAEILIPKGVSPKYITRAYVANKEAMKLFTDLKIELNVEIKSGIFF